jgi:hypothetical protein
VDPIGLIGLAVAIAYAHYHPVRKARAMEALAQVGMSSHVSIDDIKAAADLHAPGAGVGKASSKFPRITSKPC